MKKLMAGIVALMLIAGTNAYAADKKPAKKAKGKKECRIECCKDKKDCKPSDCKPAECKPASCNK